MAEKQTDENKNEDELSFLRKTNQYTEMCNIDDVVRRR